MHDLVVAAGEEIFRAPSRGIAELDKRCKGLAKGHAAGLDAFRMTRTASCPI